MRTIMSDYIRLIGKCSTRGTFEEEFVFEDGTSEEEMQKELWDWAMQYLEVWFEEVDKEDVYE